MDVITIEAAPRDAGKGASRAVRRQGNVPCVLYGHRVDPVVFQVSEKDLTPLIYTQETHVVQIDLADNSWQCVMKDITYHPVTERPMHADFQVLQKGEKVTLTAPVRYLGTPVGQTEGGQTNYVIYELEISCLPKDIPSHIDIDVSHLKIGDALHVSDLDYGDIEIHALPEQTLVAVLKPRALVEEEEAEEVELEFGEEGEEGEEEAEDEGEDA